MIKSAYSKWPIGLGGRWISSCPWDRLHKVYGSGDLGSKPSEKNHLVVSLGDEYPESKVPVCRWDAMPLDGSKDVVVAYDVVDHLPCLIDVGAFLLSCRESLVPGGLLYLFCHPFKSRLGNHLFERNMAYFHIIRGAEGVHTLKIDDPLAFYRKKISEAGLSVKEERVYREPIEDFFRPFSLDSDCEIQFVEYLINSRK